MTALPRVISGASADARRASAGTSESGSISRTRHLRSTSPPATILPGDPAMITRVTPSLLATGAARRRSIEDRLLAFLARLRWKV